MSAASTSTNAARAGFVQARLREAGHDVPVQEILLALLNYDAMVSPLQQVTYGTGIVGRKGRLIDVDLEHNRQIAAAQVDRMNQKLAGKDVDVSWTLVEIRTIPNE